MPYVPKYRPRRKTEYLLRSLRRAMANNKVNSVIFIIKQSNEIMITNNAYDWKILLNVMEIISNSKIIQIKA